MNRQTFDFLWAQAEARVENGVSQASHMLQTAWHAQQAEAIPNDIVMALVHDLGKSLNEVRHGEAIANCFPQLAPRHLIALKHHEELVGVLRKGKGRSQSIIGTELGWNLAWWDVDSFDPNFTAATLSDFLPLVMFDGDGLGVAGAQRSFETAVAFARYAQNKYEIALQELYKAKGKS